MCPDSVQLNRLDDASAYAIDTGPPMCPPLCLMSPTLLHYVTTPQSAEALVSKYLKEYTSGVKASVSQIEAAAQGIASKITAVSAAGMPLKPV